MPKSTDDKRGNTDSAVPARIDQRAGEPTLKQSEGKRALSISPGRIGGWSARHPWRALAIWLGFVTACVAAAAGGLADRAIGKTAGTGRCAGRDAADHKGNPDSQGPPRVAGTPAADPSGRHAQGTLAPALLARHPCRGPSVGPAPTGTGTGDHRGPPMGQSVPCGWGPFGPRGIGILAVLPAPPGPTGRTRPAGPRRAARCGHRHRLPRPARARCPPRWARRTRSAPSCSRRRRSGRWVAGRVRCAWR